MKKYYLKNIDCPACAAKIEEGLSKLDGVNYVSVDFVNSSLLIDSNDIETIKKEIYSIEPKVEVIEKKENLNLITGNELFENKFILLKIFLTIILLISAIVWGNELRNSAFYYFEIIIYLTAYIISGGKVIIHALRSIIRGKIFNEHFLMTIATLGAFAINQMSEAVAVMLFYVVGEFFQELSVNRSRKSIKSLLEIKPDSANLLTNGEIVKVNPDSVPINSTILIKAGERIPLDGLIIEGNSFVNTSALTGESVPKRVSTGDNVLAGMINQNDVLTVKVTKPFSESSISKIIELVENASSKKAETEKFITTFAKYYTPVVVAGALLLAIIPPLLFAGQTFDDWIYRALVVLVISCPCALVISIPLGYFGGIGGASKKGILIKGSNFLDALTKVKKVVFDKTGTLTKGEFKVTKIITENGYSTEKLIEFAAHAEAYSNHPIAVSIREAYQKKISNDRIGYVKEIPGKGIKASIDGKEIIVGNDLLMHFEDIPHSVCNSDGTTVHIVINKIYAGYFVISDSIKDDSIAAIKKLNEMQIETVMLTGDNNSAASFYASIIGIKNYYAELLPEDKVLKLEEILSAKKQGDKVAFVGDGINDAPVIARSDIGIAMGALGSDAAIETADVVLMTDSPLKVVTAIEVAQKTRKIVWQNIYFALGVKLLLIFLGALGLASMWEAVFGDMGVALIAVFNAMRVMK